MGVRRRLLNFTANYNHNSVVQVTLPDTLTVSELKEQLAAELDKSEEELNLVWQDQRITATETVPAVVI